MLEYTKTIMHKVSFSRSLLQKELGKALKWLNQQEREELAKWTRSNFGTVYEDLLKEEKEEVIF
jgi:hypothetical protein